MAGHVLLAPSVLAAHFERLTKDLQDAEAAGADLFHLDVMDGHFVPNISFGPAFVATVRTLTKLPLDTHLMIENPDRYLEDFRRAGTDRITVHAEACRHLQRTISSIRLLGMKPGVCLNPATPLVELEEIFDDVDLILLMSVNPGFGGQKFIDATLDKIHRLRGILDNRKSKALIEVDGGIEPHNVGRVVAAGADVIVAGTAVFRNGSIAAAIASLRAPMTAKRKKY